MTDAFAKFGADRYDPKDLTLSLSYDLQQAAVAALGKRRGAVVMLDPTTGEVLALASTPTYDASAIAEPGDRQGDLRGAPGRPGPAAPAARHARAVRAGLGVQDRDRGGRPRVRARSRPTTTYKEQPGAEKNGLLVDGFRVRDGHHPATGSKALDLVEATEVSCNIYYALTGLETGGEELVDYADADGLRRAAPVRPADRGLAGDQRRRDRSRAASRDDVELANASYGQAETFVTPLQMALVASTVANDGELMRPRLVTAMTGERSGTRTIGPRSMGRVHLAPPTRRRSTPRWSQAVEGPLGRQFTTGAKVPGVTTAGKSGTAELGGTGEPHSWFIGFAPAEDPKVVIAVLVEQAGRGAEVAAPIAGDLMTLYLKGAK